MAKDYSKFTHEELIKYIEELQSQLKSEKYGLYWDKTIEKDINIQKLINNIPVFKRDNNLFMGGITNNVLIEGDNMEALIALNMICNSGLVDIVYIDPPYNTGNKDFKYNDSFIGHDDGYFHSKWLSFMNERLLLCRNLMKEDAIIFISIDDNEYANLKLLCDSIFGERNYLTMFIRKTKSMTGDDGNGLNIQHEYLLVYAKDKNKVTFIGEKKTFDGYSNPDDDPNGIWCSADPSAKSGGETTYFPIENPYTGQVDYPPKGRYWAFSQETMKKYISNGRIKFKTEIKKGQRGFIFKRYAEAMEIKNNPVDTLYFCDNSFMNSVATAETNELLGAGKFNYPKPVDFIKQIIKYTSMKNSIIVDFFAGSGTTGQAVLELNKEDGGNRRFILCTNNENNICTDVTYPRLKTVITGIRPDGTKYSDGIPANLVYYKTDFIKDSINTDQAKYCLVEKVDELLCISEDIFVQLERNDYSSHYVSNDETRHMFIYSDYYNESKFNEFKQRVLKATGIKIVYVFSSDNNVDETLFEGIKDVEVKPIPSKIYEIYKEIVEDIKRR